MTTDQPVLYSFRRCPYAMRARWALLAAGLLVELRDAEHPGVLAVAGPNGLDGRLLDEVGAVEVGKALTEVDGPGLLGQPAHLGEDRRAEGGQPVGDLGRRTGDRFRRAHRQ